MVSTFFSKSFDSAWFHFVSASIRCFDVVIVVSFRAYNGEVNYLPVAINPLQRQICTAGCVAAFKHVSYSIEKNYFWC